MSADYIIAKEADLLFVLGALDDFSKELKQLEIMHEWFYSDARDKLQQAHDLLGDILEVENDEPYDDDEDAYWDAEAERLFAELCIEREGDDGYWSETEDYE